MIPMTSRHTACLIHRLLLRISADCQQSLFPMSRKFGCSVEEARDLLHLAESLLEVPGIR